MDLILKLKNLVQTERKITAEIVELLKEIDRKRLYLDRGHTSMFAFLTKEMGYTPSSAIRRIDAARLLKEIPQLKEDLKSGAINLSQASMVVQAVRQKAGVQLDGNQKQQLIEKVKTMDLVQTQKTLAQELNFEIKAHEKKIMQKDESIRIELTLTKEQFQELERVKELISHQNLNPSISDLIEVLTKNYLKQKDPLKKKARQQKITTATDALPQQNSRYIPQNTRLKIFQRDQCCQWRDSKTGLKCESRFQLQIDHIQSVWRGGVSHLENLQLLCSTHNQLKYQQELRPI